MKRGSAAVLRQILAGSFLEPDSGTFAAPGPAIKLPVWKWAETAVLRQILAGSLLEPDSGTFAAPGPAIKLLVWK